MAHEDIAPLHEACMLVLLAWLQALARRRARRSAAVEEVGRVVAI